MRWATGVVWLCLSLPAPALAQRALFDPGDVADAAPIAEAIRRSTGLTLLTRDELVAELPARAAAVGPDETERAASEAFEVAHRAYVELRLGAASRAYGEGLDALLRSERRAASPERIAQVFFERSLMYLAAHRRDDAERAVVTAITIFPRLAPDEQIYGAPVLELLERARRTQREPRTLRVTGAPADAVVQIDGQLVRPDEPYTARGAGPHLVTAEALGYRPRSVLVTSRRQVVDLSLSVAPPSEVALQLSQLESAPPRSLLLRATEVDRIVRLRAIDEASAASTGVRLDATVEDGAGRVLARAAGQRLGWEPVPWYVLAERLAGREVTPPDNPDVEPTSLAVAAPRSVHPGEEIPLRLTLADPVGLVRRLRADCDGISADEPPAPQVSLAVVAPERLGPLACSVAALDAVGGALLDRALEIDVVPIPPDDTGWWVLGASVLVAVLTAASVLAAVLYEPPQRLVIGGLD